MLANFLTFAFLTLSTTFWNVSMYWSMVKSLSLALEETPSSTLLLVAAERSPSSFSAAARN